MVLDRTHLCTLTKQLCQDVFDHMTMHVGQSELSALVCLDQTFVIDPQQMQNRCLQIMDVNPVFTDVNAQFV